MKVQRQLSGLEPIVLDPVADLKEDDWYRSPDGKWNVAQVVEHLAISMDLVATGFEARAEKTGMERRATPSQSVVRHMLLGPGKLPAGMEAPDYTRPSEGPDREQITARFRMGVERTRVLLEQWPEERQLEVFLRHPIMGDLNLPEWVRFHFVHCKHHGRQIEKLLEWLEE
ncbi:MAG: DinB family protein [Gemmatimonadales bacterium]